MFEEQLKHEILEFPIEPLEELKVADTSESAYPNFLLAVPTAQGTQTVQLRHGDLAFNEWVTTGLPGFVKHWAHVGIVMQGSNGQWYIMEQVESFQTTPLSEIKRFTRGHPGLGFSRIRNYDAQWNNGNIHRFVEYMFKTFHTFGFGLNPLYIDNRFTTLVNPVTNQKLAYCSQEVWLSWYAITKQSLDGQLEGLIYPDAIFEAQQNIFDVKLAAGSY